MRHFFSSLISDKILGLIVLALIVLGLFVFVSASFGLVARGDGFPWRHFISQIVTGLIPGLLLLILLRYSPLKWIMRASIPLYICSIALTLLVFVPGIGAEFNGARRWIDIGIVTIQPGELLKLSTVLMLAAFLSYAKDTIASFKSGLVPFLIILGIPVFILLLQPNTSTALIISFTSLILYAVAGGKMRDFFIMFIIGVVVFGGIVYTRPYVLDRVQTFINPSADPQGEGYQIQQSLIAIGSGGLLGEGYGQSSQKFNYLPEPVGDSIFAVYAEEFGFIGSLILLALFLGLLSRGLYIASEARNTYSTYAATGIAVTIVIAALMNISAMVGLFPLTGLPLPFLSHGGTALLVALASVGILLNIAHHSARKKV